VGEGRKGLVVGLIRGAILRDPDGADFLQFDAHLSHIEYCTILGRGFRMGIAHMHHVFHGWLDRMPLSDGSMREG